MNWKKKLLSSTYEIYSQNIPMGWLKEQIIKAKAYGELDGQRLSFSSKGFFKSYTDITDTDTGKMLGYIRYNTWMTKADISIRGESYLWKYDNTWQTRWSIIREDGMQLRYNGHEISGRIEGDTGNSAALLTGLFATTYNWQITLIAVFVPIIVVLFT